MDKNRVKKIAKEFQGKQGRFYLYPSIMNRQRFPVGEVTNLEYKNKSLMAEIKLYDETSINDIKKIHDFAGVFSGKKYLRQGKRFIKDLELLFVELATKEPKTPKEL